MLRGAAVEQNMSVTGDDRVSEAAAAHLLGLEPESLGKRRQEGKGPPSYRVPVNGGRISYRLHDIARWIEAQREDF